MKKRLKNKTLLISVCTGIVALVLFSTFQKLSMGIDPFVFKGFFIPVFIGGMAGFIIGSLLNKNTLLIAQLKSLNESLEVKIKDKTKALSEKNKKLQKITNTDALTLISNRRHADSYLRSESKRLTRCNSTLSVILCDIDHFKQCNDSLGHHGGDDCLRQVANLIDSSVHRESDLVARFGGEEFIIILPNTPINEAIKLAENIRVAIEEMVITINQEVKYRLTMSFGVASISSDDEPIQELELIKKADKALYTAKSRGRNNVCSQSTIES